MPQALSSAFTFRITDRGGLGGGADGIAFVVQSVSSSIGGAGGGLGYRGIDKSVAVEFDTFLNGEFNDPSSNHIAIDKLGNINHGVGAVDAVNVETDFDNGEIWYVWVDYDGTNLEVRASTMAARPELATLVRAVDIPSLIEGNTAFIGFTSATGSGVGNHDILSWTYRPFFAPIGISDVTVTATALRSAPPGTNVVVSGSASSKSSTDESVPITHVTVNGIPVESLDSDGRFYTRIPVQLGRNEVVVSAFNGDGSSASTTLEIDGRPIQATSIDFSQFLDNSAAFSGVYFETSFNDAARLLHVDLATRNDGQFVSNVPLLVGVKNINDPSVQLVGFDGYMPDGTPYYDYTEFVASGRLQPGQLTESPSVLFHNPNRVQFDYELVFLSKLNEAPYFTSVPRIEVIAGRSYVYDADAVDANGDVLSYSLLTAPEGMSISASTGVITWATTAEDIGQHLITVAVSDGRGGSAEQRYSVSVIAAPPNRPPVIITTPVTKASVAESLPTRTITDGEFKSEDWEFSALKIPASSPSESIVNLQSAGGNDGEFHQLTHRINAGDYIFSDHLFRGSSFSPEIEGAIDSIDFSIDLRLNAGASAIQMLVEQGGKRYYTIPYKAFSGGNWTTYRQNGLTAADFDSNPNVGSNSPLGLPEGNQPDFSHGASPLRFGYTIGNTASGAGIVTSVSGADNWTVTLNRFSSAYVYNVDAIDQDSDPLSYSLVASPVGMRIDDKSGLINWLPTASQVGDHQVKVQVTDRRGGVAEQEFVVCVHPDPSNNAPIIVSTPGPKLSIAGSNIDKVGLTQPESIVINNTSTLTTSQTVGFTLPSTGGSFGTADIIFIVDESGSMGNEQVWLREIAASMDTSLTDLGLRGNRYGLVGFADSGRILRSGADSFMSISNFTIATSSLTTFRSGREDGYEGVDFALDNYSFRPDAARAVILVTDEERTTVNSELTFESTVNRLANEKINFSLIGNALMRDSNSRSAFGVDADGVAYVSDGSGGFISTTGGVFVEPGPSTGDTENIKAEYVDLAWAVEGVSWDLNFIRSSPEAAAAFTSVFVDVLGESIVRDVPITVVASSPDAKLQNLSGVKSDISPGESVSFDIQFSTNGQSRFDLLFVNANSNEVLASIPVIVNNSYEYEIQAVDPDNDTLTYTLVSGPVGMSVEPTTGKLTWVPDSSDVGSFPVSVMVTDSKGSGDRQDFTVTLDVGSSVISGEVFEESGGSRIGPLAGSVVYLDQNRNGIHDIGEPRTVSAVDGTYRIGGLSDGSYTVRQASRSGFTSVFPNVSGQAYDVSLTSSSNVSGIDFGSRRIASGPNGSPIVVNPQIQSAETNKIFLLDIAASDPENDSLTYTLPSAPSGMTVHPTLGRIVWQPRSEQVGFHTVVVEVTDSKGASARQSFSIEVVDANLTPVFTNELPSVVVQNRKVSVELTAIDPDGGFVTVALGAGTPGELITIPTTLPNGSPGQTRYRYEWTPSAADVTAGTRTLRFEARDSDSAIGVLSAVVAVVASADNRAPIISSTAPKSVYAGIPYRYAVQANDPDGHALTYTLSKNPPGMAITPEGFIEWNASTGVSATDVEVTVTDAFGGSAKQAFTITPRETFTNTRPTIVSNPRTRALDSSIYEYDAEAIDNEGDAIRWSLDLSPKGMAVDASTGKIRWQPTDLQLGKHLVTVRATDQYGASSTQSFEVDVTCVNTPPVILSSPGTNAFVGVPYFYPVRANDIDGDALQFRMLSSVTGMTVSENGLIRWTPSASDEGQSRNVVVEVSDGAGGIAIQRYSLVVGGSSELNRAPSIVSSPNFSVRTGSAYEYRVNAVDADGDSLSYRIDQKPAWMTINAATGVISGTPPTAVVENIVVEVTDGRGATATQAYTLTVRGNSNPVISSTPITAVSTGAVYRYYVRATDADSDPLAYSLVNAPSGMTIDSNGLVRWEAGTTASTDGVTVRVTDPFGGTAEQTFNISVTADTVAPQVSLIATKNIFDVGSSIQLQVRATDNVGVVERSLNVGGVSIVLDSNGVGTYTGTVQQLVQAVATAKDAAGNSSQASLELRVLDPTDNEGPRVVITSPAQNAEVTYLTDIVGSVTVATGQTLEFYRVEYAPAELVDLDNIGADNDNWRVLSQGNSPVVDGKLATFDPTMLRNGNYVLRVVAFNTNGRGWAEPLPLSVTGDAKFGQFQLEFTDLTIPLMGIPIQITREYNTLDASVVGDFGNGWSLGGHRPEIFETNLNSTTVFLSNDRNFIPGTTKVYLTNPEGRRVGFTYTEETVTHGQFAATFRPKYVPDPGVYDQLSSPGEIVRGLFGFLGYNPSEYTLTTKDNLKYRYTESDGLVDITDLNGNTLTYSDNGIVHSGGASIQFVRDSQNRIREIIDPDGNKLAYTYDASGNLREFTDQTGQKIRYTYLTNPEHYLNEAFDARGIRTLQVVYDASGRYEHVVDALGNIINVQQTNLSAREGVVRDGNGNEIKLIFNDRGNVLEEIDPQGNKTIREYNDARNPDLETRIIDRRGFIIDREYDSRGNLLKIIERGTAASPINPPIVSEFTYDSGNRVTSITNALGNRTTLSYDANGKLIGVVNAEGNDAGFTYDDNGRRLSSTDFNGNVTRYEYKEACPCGSPSKVINADNTYETYEYNRFGQVTKKSTFEANGTLAAITQLFYDASGRLIREIIGGGDDSLHPATDIRKFYDGNLLDWEIIVSPESLNPDGSLKESPTTPVAQRKSRITDFEYDSASRLIRQIDAMGGIVNFRYDVQGNRLLLQDPVGNITTWTYDILNRVAEERDPLYWVAYAAANASEFAGKAGDSYLDQVIVANREPSGASLATNQGAAHVRSFAYDAEGNQSEFIDRNNRRREFSYDRAGRLLSETWYAANNGPLVETIRYSYDALGNMLTAENGASKYTNTYDVLSRLRSTDNNDSNPDTPRVILFYDYDAQGNVIRTYDDSGVTVESIYNNRNQLATRKWYDGDVPAGGTPDVADARVDFFYNALGRERQIRRYSDLTATTKAGSTDYTYDLSGRTDTLVHKNAVDALLSSYDYNYDFSGLVVGEIRDHQDNAFDDNITYRYDLTGQLVEALFNSQDDERYAYDLNGNRTSSQIGSQSRVYRTGPGNRLLSDGEYEYTYDGEGNQITKKHIGNGQETKYFWDHDNDLTRVETRSSTGTVTTIAEFVFDSFGRRIMEKENGNVVLRVVHDADNTWGDYDLDDLALSRYLFSNGVDRILAHSDPNQDVRWFLVDKQGTVRADFNSDGVQTRELSAFGSSDLLTLWPMDRFSFTGREATIATDLLYFRNRFYSPSTGRFVSVDPIGFLAGDANLYRYVRNSPLNATDPTGTVSAVEYVKIACLSVPSAISLALISGTIFSQGVGGVLQGLNGLPVDADAIRENIKNALVTIISIPCSFYSLVPDEDDLNIV